VSSAQRAASLRLADAAARLRSGQSAWLTPGVASLRDWIEREHAARVQAGSSLPPLLAREHEWLLWHRAAAQIADEHALASPAALADRLRRAARLAADHAIAARRIAADPGREARCLAQASAFVEREAGSCGAMPQHALLAAAPVLERERGLARAAAAISGHCEPPVRVGHGPLPEGIVTWMAAAGWSAAPAGVVGSDALPLPEASAEPRVCTARDPGDELERAAEWAATRLERDRTARLLVVVPDLHADRARVERVFGQRLDAAGWGARPQGDATFVIEGGEPIGRHKELAVALDLLALLLRPVPAATLVALLQDFALGGASASTRARWATRVAAHGLDPVSCEALLRVIDESAGREAGASGAAIDAVRAARACLTPARAPLLRRVAEFDAALGALGALAGEAPDSATYQRRRAWHELLAACGRASAGVGPCGAADALALVRALAERQPFAPASGDVGVTITAEFEDPTVGYDAIRVCGLRAERWPQPVSVDPFVPWYLQRDAGVQPASAAGRLAQARRQLAQWRARTGELVLSWPESEDDARLVPSPLLARFRAEDSRRAALPLALRIAAAAPATLEVLEDGRGRAWPASQAPRGGASVLDRQNQCPFRAYAQSRLAARSEPPPEPGIDPTDRGAWLHRVLARLWGELGGSARLAALDEREARSLVQRVVDDVFRDLDAVTDDATALRQLQRERRRTVAAAVALLRRERDRAPFEVVARERAARLALAPIELQLQLDRVDRLADGGLVVLDYKSGAPQQPDWDGPRPEPLQLFVYEAALAAEGSAPVVGLALVHVQPAQARFVLRAGVAGVLPRSRPDPQWSGRLERTRAHVAALAQAFAAGDARVDPRSGACRYCELTSLCRRVERGLQTDRDDEPGAGESIEGDVDDAR
jgi:probable DNA repair protein